MRRHGPVIAQCTDSLVFPKIVYLRITVIFVDKVNFSVGAIFHSALYVLHLLIIEGYVSICYIVCTGMYW